MIDKDSIFISLEFICLIIGALSLVALLRVSTNDSRPDVLVVESNTPRAEINIDFENEKKY